MLLGRIMIVNSFTIGQTNEYRRKVPHTKFQVPFKLCRPVCSDILILSWGIYMCRVLSRRYNASSDTLEDTKGIPEPRKLLFLTRQIE